MEEAFENLRKEGKNNVDNLVKWMKDAKVIDESKEAETRARTFLSESAGQQKVNLEKFKSALQKLATEQRKSVDDLKKNLAIESSRLLDTLMADAKAFKDTFMK